MSRYKKTGLKVKKSTGKSYRGTTLYKKIPETNEDIWVITQYGDRLDLIAYQFYGDATLWWAIAQANNIKGSMKPAPGTSLRIPPKEIIR
tara:strand:+ start:238 stop:507 length:270 start_codon:yes stop_codon:yes gene_type:complete